MVILTIVNICRYLKFLLDTVRVILDGIKEDTVDCMQ